VLPERVPAGGLPIPREGEPGKPEVTLSPLRYDTPHRAHDSVPGLIVGRWVEERI
jgi:hypothetical protein